jgi:hypothetical protein
LLYKDQTTEGLMGALKQFQPKWYDSLLCKSNAGKFSKNRFKTQMKQTIEELYNTYTSNI